MKTDETGMQVTDEAVFSKQILPKCLSKTEGQGKRIGFSSKYSCHLHNIFSLG